MKSNVRFKRLLEAGRIGTMGTRNRIVMPAMGTRFVPEGLYGLDRHKEYYGARAKGGAGLVITEITTVEYTRGRTRDDQLRLDNDQSIPGMSELAEAITKHGARAAVQLWHPGAVARSKIIGVQPVAPSAISRPGYDQPQELTVAEIADLINSFARAAERAKKAGFDGIEIHGAHRYLIAQFLSSAWNKREDNYGGNLRNRARFLLEILKGVRELVGRDYPVWCRLNGKEYGMENGTTIEETQEVAVWLEEAGIDAISISANPAIAAPYQENDLIALNLPPYGPGSFVPFAEALKKVLAVPVIVVSKISPRLGERILRQRKADFIAMGRPLVAEPELPNKLASGKLDEIAPCLYCNCCAVDPFSRDCTVNAAMGREQEYAIKPVEQVKKILVVGGGPAGMEAARVAALRGHRVILYEKQRNLGGQLVFASILKDEYEKLNRYLAAQMRKLGVEVVIGKEVTPALVDYLRPDVVIVATGGISVVPEIPGIHADNILSTAGSLHTIRPHSFWSTWVKPSHWRRVSWSLGFAFLRTSYGASAIKRLVRWMAPFGRKVVVMGSGLAALQLANFLAEKGKNVTILAPGESLVMGQRPMYPLSRYLFHRLVTRGVCMLTKVKYQEIIDKGIVIIDKDGKRCTIEADTIVLALGATRNDRLANELKNRCREVYLLGDASEPFGIREAIADGSRIARII